MEGQKKKPIGLFVVIMFNYVKNQADKIKPSLPVASYVADLQHWLLAFSAFSLVAILRCRFTMNSFSIQPEGCLFFQYFFVQCSLHNKHLLSFK